ncbi:MAG: hypothetical protein OXE81_08105 [Gammaproteobacteria bacterium]|nr:hypothetical protein [Gammaproteobacteria bacterium]
MILPTKHIRAERAIIGIGGRLLELLHEPMTVSTLWDALRKRRSIEAPNAPISYDWFILTLDFLFMIGAVEIQRGLLSRTVS